MSSRRQSRAAYKLHQTPRQPSPSTSDHGSNKDTVSFQTASLARKQEPDQAHVHTFISMPMGQTKPLPPSRNGTTTLGNGNTFAPPIPPHPKPPVVQADNAVGEVVDLSSIYVVDEMRQTNDNGGPIIVSNRDQLTTFKGEDESIRSAPVYEGKLVGHPDGDVMHVVCTDDDDPETTKTVYDEELETWETYL